MTPDTPKKTAAPRTRKPAAEPAHVEPQIAEEEAATTTPAALRLKELVDRVTTSIGGKKKGVKEIVEATLTQLGTALQNGEPLVLPGLGRVRIARSKGAAEGSAMTLKLRIGAGEKPAEKAARKTGRQTLVEPAEQS